MNGSVIRCSLALLAVTFGLCAAGNAMADTCAPPKLLNSLPLEKVPDSDLTTVTAVIDGSPEKLVVGTGAMPTQIWNSMAAKLDLPVRPNLPSSAGQEAGRFYMDFGGRFSDDFARISKFTLGSMETGGFHIQVAEDPTFPHPAYNGVLGTDMMQRYDIDLDFAHQKLNYFAPEECKGAGIYWSPSAVTEVDLVAYTGLVYVPVNLDGHILLGLIDTSSDRTFLNPEKASKLFGLSWGSLETGDVTDGGALIKADLHPFSRLTLGGLTVNNPQIAIPFDALSESTKEFNANHVIPDRFYLHQLIMADLVIGMDVLKYSHLYISFRNQRVYISAAGDGQALKPGSIESSWLTVWQRQYDRYGPWVRY